MSRLLALLFVLALAACGPSGPAEIRVWSATDADAMAPLVAAFERAVPDVRVIYKEYNTSELSAAVLDAVDDPDLGPDVVISSAADLQVALVNAGLAAPIEVAAPPPEWARWRGELYGFTAESVLFVYNKRAFAGRPLPQTRSELAAAIRDDPAFFDARIGTYDIGLSGVGYMFATQDAARGAQAARLVETLGRARTKVFCCTEEITRRVASGELVLGVNVIGSYARAAAAAQPDIGIGALNDYTLLFTRSAFVPRWSPRREAAARFVGYLVSPDGQREIARQAKLTPLEGATADGADTLAGAALMPIRLSPGLLTFLDTMKKASFLRDWSESMRQLRPAPAASDLHVAR